MSDAVVAALADQSKRARGIATLQIFLTTIVWGFGFVTVKWAVEALSPLWLTALRFSAVFGVAAALTVALPKERRFLTTAQMRLAFVPGLLLAGMLLFQTWGMASTTVTNSGFITTLYVVIVPVMNRLLFRAPVAALHWLFVAVAVAGTALICDWGSMRFNPGDALVLIAAFLVSAHLIYIERINERVGTPFSFNAMQSGWAAVFSLPFALVGEGMPVLHWSPRAGASFIVLVGFCSVIGFTVQVSAQRVLSATFVSVVFLLESPFAALFGWWLLGERPTSSQLAGAGLIFAAAAGACLLAMAKPSAPDL